MIVKLFVLGLVVLSCLGNANGGGFHKCYECLEADSALLTAAGIKSDGMTCKHKILELKWSVCPEGKPYCLIAKGTVAGGKKVEQRSCAAKEFKGLMGNKMGCKSAKDVDGFKFGVGTETEGLVAESGNVCLCDTPKCNMGTQPHPYPIYSFVIAGILLALVGF